LPAIVFCVNGQVAEVERSRRRLPKAQCSLPGRKRESAFRFYCFRGASILSLKVFRRIARFFAIRCRRDRRCGGCGSLCERAAGGGEGDG